MQDKKALAKQARQETSIIMSVDDLYMFTCYELARWLNINTSELENHPAYYAFRKRMQMFLLQRAEMLANKHLDPARIAELTSLQLRSLPIKEKEKL